MDERVGGVYIEVSAERDKAEPKKTISELRAQAAKERPIEVEVKLDKNGRARDQLGRFVKGVNREKIDLPVNVHGDDSARARLVELARDRVARILVAVDKSSVSSARTYLKSFTGGNLLEHATSSLSNLMKNLDTATLSVAKLGTAFGSMSSLGVAAFGTLATASSQLTSIASAGLALPGIFTGFAVGILGSLDGLQNINVYMREASEAAGEFWSTWYDKAGNAHAIGYDIVEELKNARLDGGKNFWAEAGKSLLALRDNLFIPFFNEYRGMMTHLGTWWGKFFDGISSGLQQVGGMSALFEPLNRSIQIATAGAQPFIQALIKLGAVGGQYLPKMAESFVGMAQSFDAWIDRVTASGEIFQWIDQGVANFRLFMGVIAQTVAIFSALSSAAREAGFNGLQTIFDMLLSINKLVSGGSFREALVTVFSGAFQAVNNLLPGLRALKEAFVGIAPTISTVFQDSATALSGVMEGVSKALLNPVLSDGLEKLFGSIAKASQTLQPTFEVLGTKFGEIAAVMGTLIDTAAPLINQITTGLAPSFSSLMEGLQKVIPALGEGLSNALNVLLPIIESVGSAVGKFMEKFPRLSAFILVAVAGLAGLASSFVGALNVIAPIAPIIGSIITKLGGFGAIIGTIGGWFTKLLGFMKPVLGFLKFLRPLLGGIPGLIIGALMIIVPLIIKHWDSIVSFTKQAWDTIAQWTQQAWNNVLTFISGVVDGVVEWVQTSWGNLTTIVSDLWSGITETITAILETTKTAIVDWATGVIEYWSGIWDTVSTTVSTAFNAVMTYLSPALEAIGEVFSAFGEFLLTAWTTIWDMVTTVVSGIWEVIRAIIQGGLDILTALFSEIGATIVGLWSIAWDTIVAYLTPIVGTIVTTVTTGFNLVKDFISTVLTTIWEIVTYIWNSVVSTVTTSLNAIWNVVSSIFNQIWNVISTVLSSIWDTVSSVWNSILGTVTGVLSRIWDTVSSIFTQILDKVTSVAQAVWSVISEKFNGVSTTVSYALGAVWNTVSSIFDQVVSYIRQAGELALSAIREKFDSMRGAVSNSLGMVLAIVREIPGKIVNALGNLGTLLRDSGAALMRGFGEGISSMVGSIQEKARRAVQSIRDFFPFSPAKVGPFSGSGYTTHSGKALMTDFGASIEKAALSQRSRISSAIGNLQSTFGDTSINAVAQTSRATPIAVPSLTSTTTTTVTQQQAGNGGISDQLEKLTQLIESLPVQVSVQVDSKEIALANTVGRTKLRMSN